MLSEISVIDSINVLENGNIEVRRADRIIRGAVTIGQTYHRHVLSPGDDLKKQAARVVAIAEAVWTPEVLSTFNKPTRRIRGKKEKGK